MTLLEMSLSAGAIILLTAVLRLLAGGRLPRRMYIALWDIATLRLLVPVRISSNLNAYARLRAHAARLGSGPSSAGARAGLIAGAASGSAGQQGALVLSETIAQGTAARPQAAAAAMAGAKTPSLWERLAGAVTPERVLAAVWIAGVLVLTLHFIRAYVRSARLFGESLPDTHPETKRFLAAHPTFRRVRVRLSGCIASPLSYGVARPVILLPKGISHEDTRALCYVLLHELMHIRALDAVRKLLVIAGLCLHWMNPLVTLMFLLVNRDMELLCDERVLAACPGDARREYALTLLAMEESKARLSPVASSFSVNAIEERIKAMMNMKKKSAMSLLLAAAIVVTSSAALATSAPEEGTAAPSAPKARLMAGSGSASASGTETYGQMQEGDPFLSQESWEEVYEPYTAFGLGYDAKKGRLTYEGQIVRLFEDMYPVGDQTQAGTVCSFADGEVDVYAVRDLTGPIIRREDGSFDPSGQLTGLRRATQEEFDAETRRRESSAARESGSALANESGELDVVWWTAEEFRAFMEEQREALSEMAAAGEWAYTGSDGWFQWTPEKVEEAMALYADILAQIESGVLVSKTVNGSEEIGLMQSIPSGEALETLTEDAVSTEVSPDTVVQSVAEAVGIAKSPVADDPAEKEALAQVYADWDNALAPYVAVGLRWTIDADGSVRMYVGEREARGIWDAHRGEWITWSMGNTRFDGEAREFVAVYDGEKLTGLREADESEEAFWNKQRGAL